MRSGNVSKNDVKFFVLMHKFTVTEKLQFVNQTEPDKVNDVGREIANGLKPRKNRTTSGLRASGAQSTATVVKMNKK